MDPRTYLAERVARARQQPYTWRWGRYAQWDEPGEPNVSKPNPHPKMRGVADPAERERMAIDRGADHYDRAAERIRELIASGRFTVDEYDRISDNPDDLPSRAEQRRMRRLVQIHEGHMNWAAEEDMRREAGD